MHEGGIESKANAFRKAKGYADGLTITRKIKELVAVNTSKTSKYKVEWVQDIPICKGQEPVIQKWQDIDWKRMERIVFKLQKRIYQASKRGDVKAMRRLQKTLIRSWSARCIAVRRVTQDNGGKKTAGVDGVKSLSPVARFKLANKLRITGKSFPTRRVWIPKPGTEEKRPLGIPTMYDRALQALVKLALEPSWEARFEPNSYGFRPGRSCHDAIAAIFNSINKKAKYVLDADITKCFDRINHEQLLRKLNTFPTLGHQIKAWLKSGVMDGKQLFPTFEGTPQGGVISPLLANIALHGMEERIKQFAGTLKGDKQRNREALSLIRYADDFVILHEDITVVQRCQSIISEWLLDMGLELKSSKTKITHTLNKYEDNVGFDFLGFHIQHYYVGIYRCSKTSNGKPLGFTTLITPSIEKLKIHLEKIGKIIDTHKTAPQAALISELNPTIKGWANYYSTVVSKETFSKADNLIYLKLRAWVKRRGKGTINKDKYWRDGWFFKTEDGIELMKHADTKVNSGGYVKVQGTRSPYDGDWVYWTKRMGNHPEVNTRVGKLLIRQKGKCPHCGLYFKDTDIVEVDHITPTSLGGKDIYNNLQLLHRHCHDKKTALDGSLTRIHDKDWVIEEPDEGKLSRPVLKER